MKLTNARIVVIVSLFLLFILGCGSLDALETLAPVEEETVAPTPGPVVVSPPSDVLTNLETQVEAVYAAVGSAVVNINVTTTGYDFFLNPVPQEGSGSGFVYDADGHIVTNYHVIEGANTIQVTFADGTQLDARVVGADATYDLAVIKVEAAGYPLRTVQLGDSESLRVGQFVVAIGSPFGLEQTVTFGIISNLGRVIESPDQRYIGEAIQTDAAINPGNSGGPLLDLEGRVIGVNAQIVSTSQANAGIGFAIPARIVERVVPDLISKGRYGHPWMGVRMLPVGLNAQLAEEFTRVGFEVPSRGLLITAVEAGSPADEAGLRGATHRGESRYGEALLGGDVIRAIDGMTIKDYSEMTAYLETNTSPGDSITVLIWRDGGEQAVTVVLGERPVD